MSKEVTKHNKSVKRGVVGPGPYTIADVLAITCPICQVGPGQVCDGSFGGTYDATSRGIIHDARAKVQGLTVSLVENVTAYVPPGTAVPATASITFGAASLFANNDQITLPIGMGPQVVVEFQVDGTYTPTPGAVTCDLTSVFPAGTAEQVRALFDALVASNTALALSSTYPGVESLAWPIPGTAGNGQVIAVTAAPGAATAVNFANGVGTSTLAYAEGSVTANAGSAGFVNHDSITFQTDAGLLVLDVMTVALGFVLTPGDVLLDLTAAPAAADVALAIDDVLAANADFFTSPVSGVENLWWPVAGAVGNGNAPTASLATPASLTISAFAGGHD